MSSLARKRHSNCDEPSYKRIRSVESSTMEGSKHATYKRYPAGPKMKTSEPNRILRVSILNCRYEITTDVLHYFFSQYGYVLRIVIFTKGGLGAMVEFDSVEGATTARSYLNGFDMYWNCNKLQIEFAWTSRLFVDYNNINRAWDYEKAGPAATYYNDGTYEYPSQYQSDSYNNNNNQQPQIIFAPFPQYEPNLMMVSGLNVEFSNPDKLFNLLSLYGNVASIQFIPHQGTAAVQMYDSMSVEYCIRYLNNVPLDFYGKLQVYWSSQPYPAVNRNTLLPDGSHSFKDFSSSRNQRFLVPRPTYWIQNPSKIVRFYNTPSTVTKKKIFDIFYTQAISPKDVNILPMDMNSRLSRGLVEFLSVAEAVQAVMKCNNMEIPTEGGLKSVHIMKLCFSSSHSMEIKH